MVHGCAPNWTCEMFARSTAAPSLILRYNEDRDPTDGLDFIFRHVIECPERIKEPDLEIYVSVSPFLAALSVGMDVEFPLSFLAGIAPRLRSMICYGDLPLEARLESMTRLVYQGLLHPMATFLPKLYSPP
ncbi:hypothetical protein BDN71DRAFT_1439676 [Pleurotus eryngii]|uniref:Uncharacterized protein n=1 Tax=Pleurotus eryngii TaxID=5323 RepID=A0A9P6A8A5_PLEER|nr:hypothetical protein BDN71DRAFT_1439676 [Pleurotus eryngii]